MWLLKMLDCAESNGNIKNIETANETWVFDYDPETNGHFLSHLD